MKKTLEEKSINIYGNGNQRRNFTHVRYIAEANSLERSRKVCLNKILVIISPEVFSIKKVVLNVKEIINLDCKIIYKPVVREFD